MTITETPASMTCPSCHIAMNEAPGGYLCPSPWCRREVSAYEASLRENKLFTERDIERMVAKELAKASL